jgi:hypothetical protein
MSYTQKITPKPLAPKAEEGMCLQYVRQTFGLPVRYGSATEAWLNSPSQHRDRNYPQGVWFPVWWALDKNANGHVALVAPDGRVYSTSNLNPNPLKVHPNVADVEAYYARYGMKLTYRGWTEDVAGTPVITDFGLAAQGAINQGGLTVADIDSITQQLADIQAKLAPISTDSGKVDLRQFIADGTRAAQKAADQTGPINVDGGQEGIRDFIAKGTRAAQASAAKLAGLEAALKAVVAAAGSPVDLAAVTAAAEVGANKALSNLTATFTLEQAGK